MCQNLPRKFKINFGCCANHGLARIADIGLVPQIKDETRGFKIYLGGGLGAASFIGHLVEDFTPEQVEEFLTQVDTPTGQTLLRIAEMGRESGGPGGQ